MNDNIHMNSFAHRLKVFLYFLHKTISLPQIYDKLTRFEDNKPFLRHGGRDRSVLFGVGVYTQIYSNLIVL